MQRLKRPLNRSGAANILETGDDERENFTQVGYYQVTHYAARTTSSYSLSKNKPVHTTPSGRTITKPGDDGNVGARRKAKEQVP